MKLCKGCRYVETHGREWHSWECRHPKALTGPGINLMTGELTQPYGRSCVLMRSPIFECGVSGKLWEQKDAQEEPQQPPGFV